MPPFIHRRDSFPAKLHCIRPSPGRQPSTGGCTILLRKGHACPELGTLIVPVLTPAAAAENLQTREPQTGMVRRGEMGAGDRPYAVRTCEEMIIRAGGPRPRFGDVLTGVAFSCRERLPCVPSRPRFLFVFDLFSADVIEMNLGRFTSQ